MSDHGDRMNAPAGDTPPPYLGSSPGHRDSPFANLPPEKRSRWKASFPMGTDLLIPLVAGVVALLVGVGVGYALRGGEVGDLQAQIADDADELAALGDDLADAEEQIAHRSAQTRADEAAAARIEQERIKAQEEEEAEEAEAEEERRREAAEAEAAAQRQAEEEAAAAQRQAEEEAAAAAAAAERRRRIPGGNGIFAVGPDIDAGRWRTTANERCYYAILRSPSGEGISNIIENNNISGPGIVDLANGTYLELSNCGEWFRE